MNDDQLLRYSRHILLPQLDIEGQQTLLDSHVMMIGLGGLGSPVAIYLAAAGVGELTLVDDDVVELSNLQRQIAHQQDSVDKPKVVSAAHTIEQLNSSVKLNLIQQRLDHEALVEVSRNVDVIIDCTDNFATRFLLNDVSQQQGIPLVSAAAIRFEAQVTVYDPRVESCPCYRCLYEFTDEPELTCSESGVLSPMLGMIGSVQAVETIKLLTGIGETLAGRLLVLDALAMHWREIKLKRDPDCPVCSILR